VLSAHSDEAIRLDRLSFRYPDQRTPALHQVSLRARRGEMLVIMGATGAGKSTLAKCLNGVVPSFQPGELSGEVVLFGRPIRQQGVAGLAGTVGLVSQDFEAQLFATNVAQEVVFGMEQLGVAPEEMPRRLRQALQAVGLQGFDRRDPATLSGGEKQRLAIAATLALQPSIIVFDEPTTDLDPLGKLEIFAVLAAMRQQGYTLVVIEHEAAAAAHADRLLVMSQGQIVADDAPREILARADFLEQHGIRSPDLSRLAARLGFTLPQSVDAAAEVLMGRQIIAWGAVPGPNRAACDPQPPVPFISVEDVSFSYESGALALDGVSLVIQAGEFTAIIGQNGSGKTTLAKHLNGLLTPTSGRVLLHGQDIRNLTISAIAADIGYVFQNPDHQIFAATVREEVTFGPRNLGLSPPEVEERTRDSLRAVGLDGMEDEDPFLLGKGQRQRLAVASLLALRPQLLVLDEPTTGLDYLEQKQMMNLLARLHAQGIGIVIITHSPWVVAEYARRGVLMAGGKILRDVPLRALFAEEELLRQSHFCLPEITSLGRRLGFTPLSVDEFVAQAGAR